MLEVAEPMLERHRILHTRDADVLRDYLRKKSFRVDLPASRPNTIDLRLNGVDLFGTTLEYHRQAMPFSVYVGPHSEDYWIHIATRGALEITGGRENVLCNSGRAAIASPTFEYALFFGAGSSGFRLRVTRSFLSAQLAALLGQPLNAAPEFRRAFDMRSGFGRRLVERVHMAATDIEQSDSALSDQTSLVDFEQLIVNGLLLSQPHSHSEALCRAEKSISSRDVRRAIDYVYAHLNMPITVADMARAAGVPGRTLFKHFKDSRGISPMQFVRNARLKAVHDALLRATPAATVSEIASYWGVGHLGRFSVEYRRRFGEPPSRTLSRRHRLSG
jgi:AraC-like DNA-binding protein